MKFFGKELKFNDNKIYHSGDKPTPSDIGAAASSHTHSSYVNQNAFSNVAVSGQTTVEADTTTDTLTLKAGSNVTITTDATNDAITIAATNTDTKVTNTLGTTTKAYVTGTTSASTNTGTQVFDTGVYLDTTAGMLTATTFKGALSGNATSATSATKATQDSAGQQINTTYIKGLSVSGKVITYTKGDGTTGTITTQDTNTTYSVGTASALGLTKLYTGTGTATDGTMTQAAINTALSGKAASSHTHNYAGSSSAGGNANAAVKLATPRTIKIGNTSKTFDGTGDITWTAADIGVASINDSTTATDSVWSSNKTQTQINTSYNTMTKRVEALEETIYSDFVSKSGDTMSGDLTIKKPDGGASKIKVYRTLNSKEMEGSMDVYNGNGGSVSLSTWDRTTGVQTSSYVFGGDALWAPDTSSGTRPTLGTSSFRFGAIYGPGMIALATGSIYLGGLVSPASQNCDYLRIGSNLMASDSSKAVHFIDSAGSPAKINVASVETSGGMILNIRKTSTYYPYDVYRYCSSNTTSGYTHSTARFGCTDNEGGAATMEIRVNDATKAYLRLYQSGAVGIGGKKFSIATSAPSGPATGDVWIQI